MLELKPLEPVKRVTHTESGAWFVIEKLSPEAYQALRKQSLKPDGVDSILFAKKVCAKIIRDWGNVAEPCTEETKVRFGAAFAFNIVPWIVDEAMSIDDMIRAEELEGKGS